MKISRSILGLMACALGVITSGLAGAGELQPTVNLHNGWRMTPSGRMIGLPGDMPVRIEKLGDNRILVLTAGLHAHALALIDTENAKLLQSCDVLKAWTGLAVAADNQTAYVAGGGALDPDYKKELEKAHSDPAMIAAGNSPVLKLSLADAGPKLAGGVAIPGLDEKVRYTAGLALLKNGTLLAVNFQNDTVYAVGADGALLGSVPVGYRPGAIALALDESVAAVANWGDKSVSLIDPKTFKETARIAVGSQPVDLAYAKDGRLFVANSGADSISVIRDGVVTETIRTSLDPKDLTGSTPDALAVSPDGTRLYVANADNNNVAVINIATPGNAQVLGFIPTGWYPSALALSADGKKLFIGVGKGLRPHPSYPAGLPDSQDAPDLLHRFDYTGDLLEGYLEIVPVPSPDELLSYTRKALANVPHPAAAGVTEQEIAKAKTAFGHIKHVVYIIRENRTYDQILGDLPGGNGEPYLTFFGEEVTPNAHALARKTVVLDNLYANGEVSQDGQQWSLAAYVTNFTQKIWPLGYSDRPEPDADERLTTSPAGYLWDNCRAHGLSYISYGMFASFRSDKNNAPIFAGKKGLEGHTSEEFLKAKLRSARDPEKAKIFIKELNEAEKTGVWPAFMVMHLPENHTSYFAAGKITPTACVASNDQAIGMVVEAVSHSRFWPETAIFIIEDDAQNGPDHVDCHRCDGYVLSPWVKRGAVDSTMYTTVSFVRTIELILGLPPMNQHDENATPMYRSFTDRPENWSYTNLATSVDLNARNPKTGANAQASAKLDLSDVDLADFDEMNRILWQGFRPGVPMPAPVHGALFSMTGAPVVFAGGDADSDGDGDGD